MTSPWRNRSSEITVTGYSEEEIKFRISELEKRGYTLIGEPKQEYKLKVHLKFNYGNLARRDFQGKEYEQSSKWMCKMRCPDAVNTTSSKKQEESVAKSGSM